MSLLGSVLGFNEDFEDRSDQYEHDKEVYRKRVYDRLARGEITKEQADQKLGTLNQTLENPEPAAFKEFKRAVSDNARVLPKSIAEYVREFFNQLIAGLGWVFWAVLIVGLFYVADRTGILNRLKR